MPELTTASDKTPESIGARPAKTQPVTLITEQEVVFGAAAGGVQREKLSRRIVAVLRAMIFIATHLPPPPRYPMSRNAYYFERARIGREMDRL